LRVLCASFVYLKSLHKKSETGIILRVNFDPIKLLLTVVSCLKKKVCASVISDLVLSSIYQKKKCPKKKEERKELRKVVKEKVERSVCLCAQVLNFF
jgi:hypothetical protein